MTRLPSPPIDPPEVGVCLDCGGECAPDRRQCRRCKEIERAFEESKEVES